MPSTFESHSTFEQMDVARAVLVEADEDDDHHYDGCFEGSEKKMEIDFIPMDGSDAEAMPNHGGLRSYHRQYWSDIIAILNGCILLHDAEEKFDAYLISESSLMVYNDRIVILTCGTTLLLKTLPAFIDAAAKIGLEVSWFQYSRKNFMFPDKQLTPHKTFDMEVSFLDKIFPTGRPFVMGPMTSDHWYLFVADFIDRGEGQGAERRALMQEYSRGADDAGKDAPKVMDKDQMLNVYMYGIDPHVAQLFVRGDAVILPSIFANNSSTSSSDSDSGSNSPYTHFIDDNYESNKPDAKKDLDANAAAFEGFDFCCSGDEATERSGIGALMGDDGSVAHAHLFEPCGYSMNGSAAGGQAYWTIHITPEASCSYASFETNYNCTSYHKLIQRIIRVFRPAKFTTVEHVDQDSLIATAGPVTGAKVDGYKATGRTLTEFGCKDYLVQMCNYESKTTSYVAPVPPMKFFTPAGGSKGADR